MSLTDLAGWIAPAATMIAAMMTAANLGARVTGWGFAMFSVGAVAWIVQAVATGQRNLLLTNAFLLLVDGVGIWRWLGRRARFDQGAARASLRSRHSDAPSLFALGTLEGCAVHAPDGRVIASTVEAMARCADGGIAYLVVRAGGVGGVGERLHAIGWHEARVRHGRIDTTLTAAQLADRPVLAAERWPESAEAAGAG